MKLSGKDAARFFARPGTDHAGVLLFGPDAMRIALRRQELVRNLIGSEGEAEMRLVRMPAAQLRGDPAAALDAIKAAGFFPGQRVVLLEDATDAQLSALEPALAEWRAGDAMLVVTAGNLKPTSKLRKRFESARNALAIGIYDDPPSREEIDATLRAAGIGELSSAARSEIAALAQQLDPGEFAQVVEKLALYTLDAGAPVSPEDVAACAPASTEAALDALLHAVAEGKADDLQSVMRRLQGQGAGAVSLCIGVGRHFRALHAASCDPEGPDSGIARVRPPVHWKNRKRMAAQARRWGRPRLEEALRWITEADLTLRSAQTAPDMALIERVLIRLALHAAR